MVSTAVKADVHSAGHGFEPHRLHQGSPYQFARDKSNYLKTCEGTKRDYSDRGYNSYPPCENVVVAAQKKLVLGLDQSAIFFIKYYLKGVSSILTSRKNPIWKVIWAGAQPGPENQWHQGWCGDRHLSFPRLQC